MHDDEHTEDHEIKRPTEARQGEVAKSHPMTWVLVVSTVLAALALLVIYFYFVAA